MTDIPHAVVSQHNVYIGGILVPGLITEDGITVTPATKSDVLLMTVTFVVQSVKFDANDRRPYIVEEPTT